MLGEYERLLAFDWVYSYDKGLKDIPSATDARVKEPGAR